MIGKLNIIRKLCDLLGLPNTADRKTIIPRIRIDEIGKAVYKMRSEYKIYFTPRKLSKAPIIEELFDQEITTRSILGAIASIFYSWSACKLSNANPTSRKSATHYILEAYPSFDKIFSLRHPIKAPQIDFKYVNLQQLDVSESKTFSDSSIDSTDTQCMELNITNRSIFQYTNYQ